MSREKELGIYFREHSPGFTTDTAKHDDMMYEPFHLFNEIEPDIFLGNAIASRQRSFIQRFKTVINISSGLPNVFENDPAMTVKYKHFQLDDNLEDKDIETFRQIRKEAVNFLDTCEKPVFVHCYAGRQRSAALVAAYLIDKKGMSVKDAIQHIITKRPEAFFWGKSINFLEALV